MEKTGDKGYILCSSLLNVFYHAQKEVELDESKVDYRPGVKDSVGIVRDMHISYMMRELEITWFYYNWKNDQSKTSFCEYYV